MAGVIVARVTVTGHSMAPTLTDGQRVVAVRRRRYAVGDLVVFDAEALGAPAPRYRVKRVAAVAGQPAPSWMPAGPSSVPAGTIAVAGDNRDASEDSRQLGYVPIAAVLGRISRRHCAQVTPRRRARRTSEPGRRFD